VSFCHFISLVCLWLCKADMRIVPISYYDVQLFVTYFVDIYSTLAHRIGNAGVMRGNRREGERKGTKREGERYSAAFQRVSLLRCVNTQTNQTSFYQFNQSLRLDTSCWRGLACYSAPDRATPPSNPGAGGGAR